MNSKSISVDRVRNRMKTATLWGTSGVTTRDINQGEDGDCYYLASLAATAEIGDRIKKAFVTQSYTAEGIIVVRAYVLGVQKDIVMDDFLPFYNWGPTTTTLLFAKASPSGALWGPFLEKAWAKANGNYEIIEGGWGVEAIRFLTGAPTSSYYKGSSYTDAITAWNIVMSADKQNFTMMAGVPGASG